jgi:chromate transport protein ChrA
MDQSSVGLFGAVFSIVTMVVTVIVMASLWKVFTKAGQPGWAAIVPIYNVVVLLKIAGKPVWWLILLLVPFVNFVILIIVNISLAKNFGKGAGFAIGLVLLGFIFGSSGESVGDFGAQRRG